VHTDIHRPSSQTGRHTADKESQQQRAGQADPEKKKKIEGERKCERAWGLEWQVEERRAMNWGERRREEGDQVVKREGEREGEGREREQGRGGGREREKPDAYERRAPSKDAQEYGWRKGARVTRRNSERGVSV
jgi:hypothetical protein